MEIKISQIENTVSFTYDGESYIYTYTSNGLEGYVLIQKTKDSSVIYSSRNPKLSTDIGYKLEKLVRESKRLPF